MEGFNSSRIHNEKGMHHIFSASITLAADLSFAHLKLTRVAIERNALKRVDFMCHMLVSYQPEQLVFVDESACDRRTTYRGYAWALRGERAVRKAFFVRGKWCAHYLANHPLNSYSVFRYSILPALSLDGMLFASIVEGSFNATLFTEFIELLLDRMNPYPGPNSVIVMDNCRIHKSPVILDMIRER